MGDWGVSVGKGVGRVGLIVGTFVVTGGVVSGSETDVCPGVMAGPGCVSRTLSIEPLAKVNIDP
jgi:hypothetical protein